MEPYRNLAGDSGIVAYAIDEGRIVLRFRGGWKYEYTDASAGPAAIRKMQRLARTGRGLSTFVSTSVKTHFARKYR